MFQHGREIMACEFERLFIVPQETKIWRYMDLDKFANMLVQKALFFSHSSIFNDRLEGVLPLETVDHIEKQLSVFGPIIAQGHLNVLKEHYSERKKKTYINCWHMNEDESFGMWNVYAQKKGVAIQSTYSRLAKSIQASVYGIKLARVMYIDHDKDIISNTDPQYLFMTKRNSFNYEQELRAIISPFNEDENRDFLKTDAGIQVPVDILELAETIYVSPETGDWFKETVEGILKAFNLSEIPVVKSNI